MAKGYLKAAKRVCSNRSRLEGKRTGGRGGKGGKTEGNDLQTNWTWGGEVGVVRENGGNRAKLM